MYQNFLLLLRNLRDFCLSNRIQSRSVNLWQIRKWTLQICLTSLIPWPNLRRWQTPDICGWTYTELTWPSISISVSAFRLLFCHRYGYLITPTTLPLLLLVLCTCCCPPVCHIIIIIRRNVISLWSVCTKTSLSWCLKNTYRPTRRTHKATLCVPLWLGQELRVRGGLSKGMRT